MTSHAISIMERDGIRINLQYLLFMAALLTCYAIKQRENKQPRLPPFLSILLFKLKPFFVLFLELKLT